MVRTRTRSKVQIEIFVVSPFFVDFLCNFEIDWNGCWKCRHVVLVAAWEEEGGGCRQLGGGGGGC